DIALAQAAFPDAPFEAHKAWPEVIHRYLAGTLGLLIILVSARAWQLRRLQDQPLKLPLFLLVLVIAQGLFGMWTVTLKLWPQVVTTHLLGGFATLSLLWLLCLRLDNKPWPQPNIHVRHWIKLRPLAALGLALVIVQISLGGWVSSNYAALACPDLPTCQNQWWPNMNFSSGFNAFQEIGPNYLGGQLDGEARVAIHVTHRIGAILVAAVLGLLVYLLFKNAGGRELKNLGTVILTLLVVQLMLGFSNIIFQLPLWVAVAHNAGGALLLLSLVTLNYRLNKSTAVF
ncbi:MAG: COX15/CtaA family protein, partial [Pseudohongiellaceae bacterium]